MSVHILNEEPVHVIPSSSLVLKARLEHGPLEDVAMVTWEREPEAGVSPQRETLATCPGRRPKCSSARTNVRVKVEQQEATLQLNGYREEDSGVYAVTVTDHKGAKTTAHCIVRIYGTVCLHNESVNNHLSLTAEVTLFPINKYLGFQY